MLTIGLDLRPTEAGFKAHAGRGTGRYTEELVRALYALLDSEPELSSRLQLTRISTQSLGIRPWEKALTSILPFGKRTAESQLFLPQRLNRLSVDLVHFFAHGDAPARVLVPQVVTVLDCIPLRFPELYRGTKPNWRFRFARQLEHQAVRRAKGMIAISEATKRDVVEFLGVPEERVAVTYLGVDQRFFQAVSNPGETRAAFGLPEDRTLLLYVGGIDPRKNVPFLLRVLGELGREGRSMPLLALAGRYEDDEHYPALCDEIRRLGLEAHVRLLGFVPDERLPALYQAADVKLFPSLYEGFGLPVLEAMASGAPVVAGDNSSIPEVGGEAVALAPDNDLAGWVRMLLPLLEAPERRRELSSLGRSRARLFTWEETARKTAAAYLRFAGDDRSERKQELRHAASF